MSNSQLKEGARNRKSRVLRRAVAVPVMGILAMTPIVGAASAAQAATNMGSCSYGTWGGVWAWGDCQGSSSNVHHRLRASCTWLGSASSSWFTNGHVDIKCNVGSVQRVWVETTTW